jgi:hypothetical protein
MTRLPNLQRTADAIAAYDANPTEAKAKAVGVAFGLDTADRNDPETCAALVRPGPPTPALGETDVSFVRRMVRQWKAEA